MLGSTSVDPRAAAGVVQLLGVTIATAASVKPLRLQLQRLKGAQRTIVAQGSYGSLGFWPEGVALKRSRSQNKQARKLPEVLVVCMRRGHTEVSQRRGDRGRPWRVQAAMLCQSYSIRFSTVCIVHLLCFAAGATAFVSLVGGDGSAAAAKRGAVFKRAAAGASAVT